MRTYVSLSTSVARVGGMGELHRYVEGAVEMDPALRHMDVDDQFLARITRRLKALPA